MRVPISWLKDFVDLNISVPELAERLTLAGLEVEHVEYLGLPGAEVVWDADKIFVAQVENVERHPNADRLLLVTLVSRSKRVESRSVKLFLDLRGNSSGPPS